MRKVKRWRFYCDFCKRVSGTAHSMIRHEKGCTANPRRECGICKFLDGAEPLGDLRRFVREKSVYTPSYDHECADLWGELGKEHADELREKAGGCPTCMFAAIRQENSYIKDFDLKAEMKSLWADVNESRVSV